MKFSRLFSSILFFKLFISLSNIYVRIISLSFFATVIDLKNNHLSLFICVQLKKLKIEIEKREPKYRHSVSLYPLNIHINK